MGFGVAGIDCAFRRHHAGTLCLSNNRFDMEYFHDSERNLA